MNSCFFSKLKFDDMNENETCRLIIGTPNQTLSQPLQSFTGNALVESVGDGSGLSSVECNVLFSCATFNPASIPTAAWMVVRG